MESLPALSLILLFLLLRGLARWTSRWLGAGYKLVLLAGTVAAAALVRSLGPVALAEVLGGMDGPSSAAGGWLVQAAVAWIFMMLASQNDGKSFHPARAGWSVAKVLGLSAALLLSLAIGWSLRPGQPLPAAASALWFFLALVSGSRLYHRQASLGLLVVMSLLLYDSRGQPLYSLVALAVLVLSGGLSFVLAKSLQGGGDELPTIHIPDILATCAITSLVAGLALGLPAPAAGYLAGLAIGISGRDHQALKARYKLLNELIRDGLTFYLGLSLNLGLLSQELPWLGLGWLGILVAAILPGILASSRNQDWRLRLCTSLPVQAPAWAVLALAYTQGQLPLGPVLAVCLHAPLAALAMSASPGRSRQAAVEPAGRRVLVGLSDPLGSRDLIGFASRLAVSQAQSRQIHGNQVQPTVHAVCVAQARHDASTAQDSNDPTTAAENMLVRSVATALADGVRLIPTFSAASQPAEGLAQSAREIQANTLVLGWPGKGPVDDKAIIEQVLKTCPQLIISVRNPAGFKSSRRILVVLPSANGPLDRGQEDELIGGLVEKLADWSMRASISLLGLKEPGAAARQARRQEFQSWRELEAAVLRSERSSLVIIGRRQGDRDWNPRLHRLAKLVADNHADRPLALMYPALEAGPAGPAVVDQEPSQRLPALISQAETDGRIVLNTTQAALVDAIHLLTEKLFPSNRVLARKLAGDFFDSARKEPIELEPGIILLHAHVDGIKEPSVAIASSTKGWKLVALQFPVHIVIILCSPAAASPQVHLEALTLIAQAIRNRDFLDRLLDYGHGD